MPLGSSGKGVPTFSFCSRHHLLCVCGWSECPESVLPGFLMLVFSQGDESISHPFFVVISCLARRMMISPLTSEQHLGAGERLNALA